VIGVAIPALTRSLKVDPKIAAGPVILASADIVTVMLYFNLAGWLLG
jgi:magnesium transporter